MPLLYRECLESEARLRRQKAFQEVAGGPDRRVPVVGHGTIGRGLSSASGRPAALVESDDRRTDQPQTSHRSIAGNQWHIQRFDLQIDRRGGTAPCSRLAPVHCSRSNACSGAINRCAGTPHSVGGRGIVTYPECCSVQNDLVIKWPASSQADGDTPAVTAQLLLRLNREWIFCPRRAIALRRMVSSVLPLK